MPDNQQLDLKRRKRSNPVAQYLFSLSAMVAAYSLYSAFAVPLLEGPPNQIQAKRVASSIDAEPRKRDKSWLKPFVPADSWELESCKTVTVEGGTVLFRDYQPLEDGYAEVFPFTLILNAKPPRSDGSPSLVPKSNQPPLAVRCLKQARLKFDRPLAESMSGGGLNLEVARLVGEVTIYRPPSAIGKQDGLSVVTSNIQIEPNQIFTLEEVQFAFGKNAGAGRHLRIELDRSDQPTTGPIEPSGFAGVTGVKRIELASLQKLRLEPAPQDQQPTQPTTVPASRTDLFSNHRSPIEVSCVGPFTFDMQTKLATFNQQVRVEQLDQHRDRLNCDQLTLAFHQENSSLPGKTQSGLMLKTFEAKGLPAEVVAHSRNTKITSDHLFYRVAERQFEATSTHQVTVETPDFQLLSRQLSYSVPSDGSVGHVDARGPGRMLRPGSATQDPMLVQWQKQLSVVPENSQQHVVIRGKSEVHLGSETSLVADQIDLWLKQSSKTQSTASPRTKRQREDQDWEPQRLLANGAVIIKAPELNGTAKKLTAAWQPDASADRQAEMLNFQSNTGQLNRHTVAKIAQKGWYSDPPVAHIAMQRIQPPATRQLNQFNKGTDQAAKSNATQTIAQPLVRNEKNNDRRIDFHGDEVVVELKPVGSKTEIADLKVIGDVRVTQTSTDEQGDTKNSITGTSLHLSPQNENQQRIQITGSDNKLATFRSNKLNLDGRTIFADQHANRIWVEGQGKLWLNQSPSNTKKSDGRSGIKLSPTDSLKPDAMGSIAELDVNWAAGMIFDGRKIYFEKEVAMTAKSGPNAKGNKTLSRSFSQGLSITLTDEIRFDSTEKPNSEIKLDTVVLVDRVADTKRVFQLASNSNSTVPSHLAGTSSSSGQTPSSLDTPIVIEHRTFDPDQREIERQTVIAPRVNYSATSGMIQATGPGSIQVHQRGRAKTFESTADNTPATPRDNDKITLTHVKFDDRLVAESNKKQMNIHGQVRSLTSSVESFDDVFDPDLETNTWPVDAVKLVCQQVQLAQWNPQSSNKPSNEMVAMGNAHIISSKFEATADRVSYSQVNDMLVVEGTPRSDANLWFRRNPTARPDHLVAGKILYRLSDQWTEVQNVRNLQIKSK